MKNIGYLLRSLTTIAPATTEAATVNGTGIDKTGFEEALFVFMNSAPLGSPTGMTITCTVQDSSDNSTFSTVTSTYHTTTASAVLTEIPVDLKHCKQYVRGVVTAAFNGGTSPTVVISGACILGASKENPV